MARRKAAHKGREKTAGAFFGKKIRRARPLALLVAAVIAIAIPRSAWPVSKASPASPLRARTPDRSVPHRSVNSLGAPVGPVANLARSAPAGEVNGHTIMKDVNIQPGRLTRAEWDDLLDLAQSAGVSVIALDVNWAAIEPQRPGNAGEFWQLNEFVSDVLARGLELRFQLVGFPQWARDPGDPSASAQMWRAPESAGEIGRWSHWVSRLVSHFGSEVSYYEIWNEENGNHFWAQGANPTEYARLLEASYVPAKAADRSAVVMFGGLDRNDIGFLQATYAAADKLFPTTAVADHHFFDILGVHPYSGSDSPATQNPYWVYQDAWGEMDTNYLGFVGLQKTMAREGEGYKHIYIGEYGQSTLGWNNFPPVSAATQATDLASAFELAARTGYVDGFSWYNFFSSPWNSAGFSLLKGNYPSWRPTLAYEALARVTAR
jgi:hypothetical protein